MDVIVDINEELGQALSRASVLKSLDSSFAAVEGSNILKNNNKLNKPNNTPVKSNEAVVNMIGDIINDRSSKTEKLLLESLRGKAIILENVKNQTLATSYMEKEKRKMRRRIKCSNRFLKKNNILNNDFVVTHNELVIMNRMWKTYIKNVLKGCKSANQYQSRIQTAELIGAEIILIENCNKNNKHIGMKGIVVKVTQNTIILGICKIVEKQMNDISANSNSDNNQNSVIKDEKKVNLVTIVKSDYVIGIVLPNSVVNDGNSICIIYGSKYLVNENGNENPTKRQKK